MLVRRVVRPEHGVSLPHRDVQHASQRELRLLQAGRQALAVLLPHVHAGALHTVVGGALLLERLKEGLRTGGIINS